MLAFCKPSLVFLLAFGLAGGANAQPEPQPLPRPDEAPMRFEHLTNEDGLKSNSVYSILQDRRGFMWYGTWNGLSRYDGYDFKIYIHDPDDAHSLAPLHVRSIQEDRHGMLWIGTEGGLNRHDPLTEILTRFRHNEDDPTSLSWDWVGSILEDHDGTLWVGSYGLNRFDAETQKFTHILPDPRYPVFDEADAPENWGNWVWSIHEDRQGMLWVGTQGGLFRYDRQTDTFTRYRHDPSDPSSLSDDWITALYEDRDGTLWVGAWGLNRFDRDAETFERFYVNPEALDPGPSGEGLPPYGAVNRVQAIEEDHTGRLWVGTKRGGLNRFDRTRGTFTGYRHDPDDPRSLRNSGVLSIYEDRQGVLWVGTNTGGVSRVDRTARLFALYRSNPANPNGLQGRMIAAQDIFLDKDDVLWLGFGDVLNRLDRKTGAVTHYRHDPSDPNSLGAGSVMGVHRDRAGRFWVGTRLGGLHLFDDETGRVTRYEHDPDDPTSISSNWINGIYDDRSGRLWISTGNGLNRFDPETGTFTRYLHDPHDPDSFGGQWAERIFEDAVGRLWIGSPNGLHLFEPSTGIFKRYQHDPADPHSLSNDWVLSSYERLQEPGILWVGTAGGGLNRLDMQTERFTHLTMQHSGMPDNMVYCVLGDDEGHLWMSTDRGVVRFHPETGEWKTFDARDGLQGLEFDMGSFHQGYNGELFFGGGGGTNAIRPSEVFNNPHPPEVRLTELRLFNKAVEPGPEAPLKTSLAETEAITLRHHQNDVSFDYVGLHFSNPAKNQYQYMLEGYDDTWREVGTLREATYTNLPPGAYTFRVKAANSDGVWNEDGASLKVTILPPWWRTVWAYILYVLLLIAAATAAFRVQHARIVRREQQKAHHALEEAYTRLDDSHHQLEEAHHDLEQTHQHLRTTQKQLVQSEKMASLGALTAGIAHEIKNPLNFVNNFAEVNEELAQELRDALAGGGDVEDLLADLERNASVIAQHGKRADAIVQSMMQHASGGSGEREAMEVNALVGEYVELAYHGKRAQTPGFRVEIDRDLGAEVGRVEMVSQEIGRVLLNLLSNAFDAVKETEQPRVKVKTQRVDGRVEIRVSDNGSGIASEIKEKIFEPFFTTKPTGSGTGLGLSLAYDIVTQGHGGTLTVERGEGQGAMFIITLPVDSST